MKNVLSSKCLNLGIQQNTREYNFNVIKLPTYKKILTLIPFHN